MKSSMVCLAVFMSLSVFEGNASEAKKQAHQRKIEIAKKQQKEEKRKERQKARDQKAKQNNRLWS